MQKNAIETGSIVINGQRIPSPSTTLKNGDIITHTLHRHEPPVTAQPIGIIHEDDDIIVINKPAGVPVHPAGRYNYNSVVEIMRAERGYTFSPLPCNRLDRLTSGVMFIGKHREAADRMTVQIKKRTVKKEYLARVIGEFPEGEVICDKPILQISPKLGLNRVRANGKEARTVFKRLAYYPPRDLPNPQPQSLNSAPDAPSPPTTQPSSAAAGGDDDIGKPWRKLPGYSLVRCLPLTGRTHQIRVHLQFLGHPIANDPIYANQRVFGPSLGAASTSDSDDESILARLERMGKDEVAEAVAYHDEMVAAYERRKAERMTGERCDVCGTELYSDPGEHELGIYLHALRYADLKGKWSYETALPGWALPPEGMEGPREATRESDPLAVDLGRLGLEEVEERAEKRAETGMGEGGMEGGETVA